MFCGFSDDYRWIVILYYLTLSKLRQLRKMEIALGSKKPELNYSVDTLAPIVNLISSAVNQIVIQPAASTSRRC